MVLGAESGPFASRSLVETPIFHPIMDASILKHYSEFAIMGAELVGARVVA